MLKRLLVATLALHLAAAASWARPCVSGSLCGEVIDSSGAAVAGANVQLTRVDTGVRRKVRTDARGQWVARSLEPGEWEIVISMEGFKTHRYKSKVGCSSYRFEPKPSPIASRIVIVPLAKENGQ